VGSLGAVRPTLIPSEHAVPRRAVERGEAARAARLAAVIRLRANLEPINALADASPGFVWRLQTEAGDATSIQIFDDDMVIGPTERAFTQETAFPEPSNVDAG
jgi:Domain of unknown function (DUF3291)